MDGDDSSWVFDSLICFLNGPVWNAPLQSFIEEKSLIFEPSGKDESEYRKVHDEFKNLVDFMLGSYMEDIGITPEQFETACNNGMHQKLPTKFQENLFEQIWAANDFEMFKKLMTQKNIELQLQALELIEQKYGVTPQIFIPGDDPEPEPEEPSEPIKKEKYPAPPPPPSPSVTAKVKEVSFAPSEKQVLVEVIKQCESEEPPTNWDPEEISKEKSFIEEEKSLLVKEKEILETKFKTVTVPNMNVLKPEIEFKPPQVIDDVEMKKRQEYLKAQRDKLVAMKKQVRKKHLEIEIGNSSVKNLRPQSAKAAETVLNRGSVGIQPETLKIRKALAGRLKSEVISKTETSA